MVSALEQNELVPPGPKGKALIGNIEDYENDRLAFLLGCTREYGGVFSYSKNLYVVSDPDLVEQVLVRTNRDFAIGKNFLQENVTADQAGDWMHARGLISSGMKRSMVADFVPRLAAIAEDKRNAWPTNVQFEMVDAMEQITSTTIAQYCFGPNDYERVPQLSANLLDALVKIIGNPFALPAWAPTTTRIRINRRLRRLEGHIDELLASRENRPRSDSDIDLAAVLTAARLDSSRVLDRKHAARILIGSLLAAHRVPAAALTWAFVLLVENPYYITKIREEVTEALGDGLPDGRTIVRLRWVDWVVRETLRLYPPTWLIERTVTRDCSLGKWPLRAGQTIQISPYVIHRDMTAYEDPDSFRPERWEARASRGGGASQYAYIPFGGGPRVCLGANFSYVQMLTVLATIVPRTDLTLINSAGVKADPRNTLLPSNAVMVAVPSASHSDRV